MRHRWVEYLAKAWDAFFEDMFSFVPDESKRHLRNARREILLALRSAIDKKIEELEKSEKSSELKKVRIEKEES